jgi:hypothetical protein
MDGSSKREVEHYMNRRVEIRVCQPTDSEMARPEGYVPSKGVKSTSKFIGNKNSGF